ncbi:hypothetical protein TcasGA2_TC014306 [Tribolium castaneum]|uniref:Uncharacterized protein n=1 Tax=Tribolium castaneum TaxID=7070 RepID=D6WL70_TRICA|nr:hypothetical protein TcasGA2_TC014306 [Tribolium castaneum]
MQSCKDYQRKLPPWAPYAESSPERPLNEYRGGMYAQLNPTLMATINIRRFATGTTPHLPLITSEKTNRIIQTARLYKNGEGTYRHANGSNTEDYLVHFPRLICTITPGKVHRESKVSGLYFSRCKMIHSYFCREEEKRESRIEVWMTNAHNRPTCALRGRRSPKMAGVGGAVMIRRCFNDEVVVMETAGTGQGRSAGRAGAASRRR